MNIHYYDWRGSKDETVEAFIDRSLTDNDISGIAEDARAIARNSAAALGRLCDILATKGILNAADIIKVAGAYTYDEDYNATPHLSTPSDV